MNSLEQTPNILITWFRGNQIKSNENKCYIFHSSGKRVQVNTGTTQINNSGFQKLLGVKIDSKLTFNDHFNFGER